MYIFLSIQNNSLNIWALQNDLNSKCLRFSYRYLNLEMYISNIEAHIGCLISNAKMYECINIKSIDYEYISLHETSKLRRLIRQSNVYY